MSCDRKGFVLAVHALTGERAERRSAYTVTWWAINVRTGRLTRLLDCVRWRRVSRAGRQLAGTAGNQCR